MASIADALREALERHLAGGVAEADTLHRQIAAAAPECADAHHLWGVLACQNGDPARGFARLRRAVALAPGKLDYAQNLALALLAAGDPAAVGALVRCRLLAPMNAEFPARLIPLLVLTGDQQLARSATRQLALLQPGHAMAWWHSGEIGALADEPHAALRAYVRFATLRVSDAGAWQAAAAAARKAYDRPSARTSLRKALALDPADINCLTTLANTLKDDGTLPAALALYDRAERASCGDPTVVWNRALGLLLAGRYRDGWEAFEARWQAIGFPTAPRHTELPLWQGEDVAGRSVLLYEEQGRGDAIQFARYAPLLAARGAYVVLEVGRDLVRLMRTLDGVAEGRIAVVATGDPLPPCDLRCPLLSLPRGFATTLAKVPATVPYLHAESAAAEEWRRFLGPIAGTGKLKVGLVWAGNPNFADDRRRSPGLLPLLPLLGTTGIHVFGLQVGPGHRALAGQALPANFTDLAPRLGDFADTAAAMAGLDLVISSCTASLHLAGALGRKAFGLLADPPDWRWLLNRADSPWYPTMRLFRQRRAGCWHEVVVDVAAAVSDLKSP